ncbi:CobW family GTP-binding protein [Sediminivirga luteola]|uniref:Cobalamin biosynthesis protein CobW n=1 Tax=Sediminivirga luteola TaxID=1774748 RepID=A0A8J2TZU6_9MICO|nr:GTP-binding protein [Sediminivirga luteola]GGA21920.1 cobalamin biosynthesis protein CobW [Sediminivirga luteola]
MGRTGKPLTLIGGYLGTGKTTLVNHILSAGSYGRVAVVVNDFGSVNVDASLISSAGADTLELTNGCICCQITDDVQRTMSALAAREDIDHVVCELSGIGDPARLGSWRSYPGFRPGPVVICVDAAVTPRRLADEYVADIVTRQIAAADILVITKTDLATPAQREASLRWCAQLAPEASVHQAGPGDAAGTEAVIRELTERAKGEPAAPPVQGNPHPEPGQDASASRSGSRDPSAPDTQHEADRSEHASAHASLTVALPGLNAVQRIVAALRDHRSALVRAKGIIENDEGGWSRIQLAGDVVTTEPVSGDRADRPAPDGLPEPKDPESSLVLIAAGPHAEQKLRFVADALRANACTHSSAGAGKATADGAGAVPGLASGVAPGLANDAAARFARGAAPRTAGTPGVTPADGPAADVPHPADSPTPVHPRHSRTAQ